MVVIAVVVITLLLSSILVCMRIIAFSDLLVLDVEMILFGECYSIST